MKVSRAHRTVALTLALVVFCSSMSYSFDAHYCQGRLKSISFFGKAKDCSSENAKLSKAICTSQKSACRSASGQCTDDDACCSNRTVFLHSDNTRLYSVSIPAIEIDNRIDLSNGMLVLSLQSKAISLVKRTPGLNNYKAPPVLLRHFQSFLQSFLL